MTYDRRTMLGLMGGTTLTALLPTLARAQERGLDLSQQRYDRDRGWRDSVSVATMTLMVPGRGESVRQMSISALETDGDGDMSLTEFDLPRDLDGTKFLSHSFAVQPDDQWLYLPSSGQVRRISSRNKSGAFLGSEFTYEDLTSFKVGKYTYEYAREESFADLPCHVIQQVPVYDHTGYGAVNVWLDTEHLRPLKAEFTNRAGAHFKTLTFTDYTLYQGQFWRAHTAAMTNLTNGRETTMRFDQIAFGVGLDPSQFSPTRLG